MLLLSKMLVTCHQSEIWAPATKALLIKKYFRRDPLAREVMKPLSYNVFWTGCKIDFKRVSILHQMAVNDTDLNLFELREREREKIGFPVIIITNNEIRERIFHLLIVIEFWLEMKLREDSAILFWKKESNKFQ